MREQGASCPQFLQLQFRSDWLLSKAVSFEKAISHRDEFLDKTFHWKDNQIPKLATPINSLDVIGQKCLVIAITLSEHGQRKTNGECFAYVRLDLCNLQKVQEISNQEEQSENYYQVFMNADVIGFNTLIGEFSCIVHYKVTGKPNQIVEKAEETKEVKIG